jgi:hypothetical protein
MLGQQFIDFVNVHNSVDIPVNKTWKLFGQLGVFVQEHLPDVDWFYKSCVFRIHPKGLKSRPKI